MAAVAAAAAVILPAVKRPTVVRIARRLTLSLSMKQPPAKYERSGGKSIKQDIIDFGKSQRIFENFSSPNELFRPQLGADEDARTDALGDPMLRVHVRCVGRRRGGQIDLAVTVLTPNQQGQRLERAVLPDGGADVADRHPDPRH